MKVKHILKLLVIVSILVLILSMFCNFVHATDNFDLDEYDLQSAPTSISTPIESVAGAIISVIRITCLGIAIIMLSIIAIKYMSAAPSERADLKKSSVQYVIGAFILFGATVIFGIIDDFVGNLF